MPCLHPRPDTDIAALAREYDRSGFILVERHLEDSNLAEANAAVAWAFDRAGDRYALIRQRTYEWFREHPVFVRLLVDPVVIALARRLLGPDFHVIAAQCSRNTRAEHYALSATNLHQDKGFFPPPRRMRPEVPPHHYGFSAMYFMQDTPREMGPTELFQASHLEEHPHVDEDLDAGRPWVAAVPAGSLLIFSHRTWHRGAFNHTDRPRDLITNAYARREVDKVQLTTKQADGSEAYVPCRELLNDPDPLVQQLLG